MFYFFYGALLCLLYNNTQNLYANIPECYYTYKNTLITPLNIKGFSPAIPNDVETEVKNYLKLHPKLIDFIAGDDYYSKKEKYGKAPFAFNFGAQSGTSENRHMMEYLTRLAQSAYAAGVKLPNLEDPAYYNRLLANITIPIRDDAKYIIKSSGFLNRRANILHEMGQDNRDPELPQEKLEAFIDRYGQTTYQTISRMPYWLRIKEAIEKYKLDRIGLQEMYLVHIPGRPDIVNDSNYVIVEKNVGGRRLNKDSDFADPELKRQFDIVHTYADLWDNSEANYHFVDGKIYPIDTEQPNNQAPSNFFWKDRAKVIS